jgi:hypothetical protein
MHSVDSNGWGMVGMYSFPLYISCKYQNSSSSFCILFGNLIRIYHFLWVGNGRHYAQCGVGCNYTCPNGKVYIFELQ